MYRDEDDLQLLTELAAVLDRTVEQAGLTPGSYLILRQLAAEREPRSVTAIAGALGARPEEVADLTGRLVRTGWAEVSGGGIQVTEGGRDSVAEVEERANEAMLEYVLERPHTATVYGLVAAMQAGRFTVEDLLAFLAEGPTDADEEEAPEAPPG
jgi:DNA-binding MarR family transcriptional regulator